MKIFDTLSTRLKQLMADWFGLEDAFWILGLASVGYGVAQVFEPAAWIVCGSALFWMGVKK